MKKLIKEPLVHFLLIGLGIFLIYGWVSDEQSDENKIIIDDNHLSHLVSIWELQWNRPPTEEELQGILESYLKQEIFYREALKMNLDHNDEVVKRRLAQKMEFLSDDLSTLVDPATDEKLQAFYKENEEKYQVPYQFSFNQVVFTGDRHQDPESAARKALEKFGTGLPDAMREQGDPLSIRYRFEKEVRRRGRCRSAWFRWPRASPAGGARSGRCCWASGCCATRWRCVGGAMRFTPGGCSWRRWRTCRCCWR